MSLLESRTVSQSVGIVVCEVPPGAAPWRALALGSAAVPEPHQPGAPNHCRKLVLRLGTLAAESNGLGIGLGSGLGAAGASGLGAALGSGCSGPRHAIVAGCSCPRMHISPWPPPLRCRAPGGSGRRWRGCRPAGSAAGTAGSRAPRSGSGEGSYPRGRTSPKWTAERERAAHSTCHWHVPTCGRHCVGVGNAAGRIELLGGK